MYSKWRGESTADPSLLRSRRDSIDELECIHFVGFIALINLRLLGNMHSRSRSFLTFISII